MTMSLLSRVGKSPTSTGQMARTTPCRPRSAAGPQAVLVAPEGSGAGGIAAVAVVQAAVLVAPAAPAAETAGHSNCGK